MPLKTVPVTVYQPGELVGPIEQRIKEGPYGSRSEYFVALAIYDLLTRRPHRVTARLMSLPRRERDAVIAEIAKDFTSGKRATSNWLECELDRMVEEKLNGSDSKPD